MTANQINYAKQREEARHNLVAESIQHRQATSSELQAQAAVRQAEIAERGQLESARHNVEGERINWFTTREQARHNVAQESLQARATDVQRGNLSESIRHNKISEALTSREIDNLQRFQERSSEASLRSAKASEMGASASQSQARASLMNAETARGQLSESIRNNKAVLSETSLHNRQLEMQGAVGNVIASTNAGIASRNADTNRYNAVTQRGNVIASNVNTAFKTVSDNTTRLATSIIGGVLK